MSFAQPFANYEILARVGSGAMGTVFKARQKHLNRVVALKVLKPILARDARYVERLEREARIVARLNHANIVTAYDLGHEGGYHYFVMEFVEGRSLRQLLAEWGAFPETQVLELAIQMASALAHAFECGVTHRDVKPGNILIDGEGRAKLTDMGLARAESDLALTRDGATVGTPQYISPEQARNPHDADIRSDLYSLGATLFHMLTGQPPFKAEAIGELITKVLSERPPSVVELVPAVSDGLSLVVRKLLAKDPALRYQTPLELLADLHRVERRERPQVDAEGLDAESPPPLRTGPRRPSRHSHRVLVPVIAGVLGLALGVLLARGSTSEPPAPDVDPVIESLLTLPVDAERFARLTGMTTASTGFTTGDFATIRRRLLSELEGRMQACIAAFTAEGRAETVLELGVPGSSRDAASFVREVVVPRLEALTGYRPENLPDTALRTSVSARLAVLRSEVEAMVVARDRAFEQRLERHLTEDLLPRLEAVARAGRPDRALEGFVPGVRAFLGLAATDDAASGALGPSEGIRGQAAGGLGIGRIVAEAQAAFEEKVAAARADLVTNARKVFEELRDRFLEQTRAELVQDSPPRILRRALDALERALHREVPPPVAFDPAIATPWREIDTWLRATRLELDLRSELEAARAFEQGLDLAYAVFPEGGPEAAVRVLRVVETVDAATRARLDQHLALMAAAARLRDDLLDAALGPRTTGVVSVGAAGRALDLRVTRLDDGRIEVRHAADGRPLSFVALDFDALRGLVQVPTELRGRNDMMTRLARACSLMLRDSPLSAVDLLEGEALALFQSDCFPRLQRFAASVDPDELAARTALDEIARLRERGDSIALRGALADFERAHVTSKLLRDRAEYLRELHAWVQIHAARAERAQALRVNSPPGMEVRIDDDGIERLSGHAGRLGARAFGAGWSRSGEVAEFDPEVARPAVPGGTAAPPIASLTPLRFASPFPAEAAELAVDFEVRLGPADREPRVLFVELHSRVAAIAILPGGQIAATVLGVETLRPELLRETIAPALLAAAATAPRIVPGVFHRIRFAVRREGGGSIARVELDGIDRAPLCECAIQPSAEPQAFVGFSALQGFAVRSIELAHRGG